MKTLHLLRHAKSSWASAELGDHERELNERGKRDAPRMGRALAERLDPCTAYCSTAVRARRTLEGLCSTWGALAAQPHEFDDALYTFDYQELLEWLQDLRSDSPSCILIGHNPALTDLCNQLVGRRALDNLPTAGYLKLSLPIADWGETTEGIARLDDYLFPRDLS